MFYNLVNKNDSWQKGPFILINQIIIGYKG